MDGQPDINVLIFGIAFLANGWALWRRPDWVAGALMFGLLASIPVGQALAEPDVVGALAMLDAVVALSMLLVWTHWRSRRAQLVGCVSMIRVISAVAMSGSGGAMDWNAFAIFQNALYGVQLLIAGGWFEWLVRFADRIDPGTVALRRERGVDAGAQ